MKDVMRNVAIAAVLIGTVVVLLIGRDIGWFRSDDAARLDTLERRIESQADELGRLRDQVTKLETHDDGTQRWIDRITEEIGTLKSRR